jgi:hypothetical protein
VLRLLLFWNLGIPFRGVFRREMVTAAGLYLRAPRGSVHADRYWVAGLALKAPLCYVPSCANQKRFLAGSTHAGWPEQASLRHQWEASAVNRAYARAAVPGPWWRRTGGLCAAALVFAAAVPGAHGARAGSNGDESAAECQRRW